MNHRHLHLLPLLVIFTLCFSQRAPAQGKFGEDAPDFPPGVFNDGKHYRLEDFRGKTVVLYFYEKQCPSCRASVPKRNQVVEAYKGKPVKFIAVAAGDTLPEAKSYAGQTGLAMPVYADAMSLMEKRYGFSISLNNIWQFRVIGPDGKVAGYKMEAGDQHLEKAVAASQWKYTDHGYDARLAPAIDLLEWGQYEAGMTRLRPHLKNANAELAASAQKLYDALKAEGEQWLAQAAELESSDPAAAHDLYARVAAVFAGDELAGKAKEPVARLRALPAVKDELAARQMYGGFLNVLSQATPAKKDKLVEAGQRIVKKYPSTPTAARVSEVLKEVGA